MKKSLLALAAMGAFAGAAQAQSSVTVYGILDVGYMSQTERTAGTIGTTGANTATSYGATSTTTSGFSSSAESTSRLGLRGTEDLGGGLSALFTVETALNANNSTVSSWNNRQAFVGLQKKGLGMAAIGTQYTPIHEAVGATDPGQQNNVPGNVIYPIDQSVNGQNGASTTVGLYPGANALNASGIGGPSGASNGYTIRSNNMIKFVSDPFAGFRGKLFYVQASSTTNQTSNTTGGTTTNTGGPTTNSGYGVGLDYTWQKLLVTANFQNFKNTSAITASQTVAGDVSAGVSQYGTTSNLNGTNVNDNQMYFGVTYDFGILKAYAQYVSRKASATYDNGQYVKRTAQQIGVRGFATKTIEGWASVGTGKLTNSYEVGASGSSVATQSVGASFSGWQLGSNYWLSKRTNLYAIYGINQTGNAVYPITVSGSTAGNNAVSNKISAYAVGVRHTF